VNESLSAPEALPSSREHLRELAQLFVRLGTIAFGGPAAHIAMMEDEVVKRRGWLSGVEFLDMISACNLIPGPNSTEMALHIGQRRAGLIGLIVAGAAFILPAAAITMALAWAYVALAKMPQLVGILYGIKPVIIAVVVQAIWRLARSALHTNFLIALTVIAVAAAFAGVDEMVILLAAGVVAIAAQGFRGNLAAGPAIASTGLVTKAAISAAPFSLGSLFLIFLKIGSILFGSGYVLLAFLQSDLVDRTHWLTQSQLLDAVAVGQITPGPVFTTATFVGYILGGNRGAIVATVAIFLPAFFFVAISGPLLPRVRRSPVASAFLDGVNAGSFALMVEVTWQLGRAAVVDMTTLVLALGSAIMLLRYRINSAWLILFGGAIGGIATTLFH